MPTNMSMIMENICSHNNVTEGEIRLCI